VLLVKGFEEYCLIAVPDALFLEACKKGKANNYGKNYWSSQSERRCGQNYHSH
jgi:hypothetical protein